MTIEPGNYVDEIASHADRCGYFVVSGISVDELDIKIKKIYRLIPKYI
jgi:hypothetical protein